MILVKSDAPLLESDYLICIYIFLLTICCKWLFFVLPFYFRLGTNISDYCEGTCE